MIRSTTLWAVAAVAVAGALAGCSSDVERSDAYVTLQAEADRTANELDAATAALATAQKTADDARAEVDAGSAELADSKAEVERLGTELAAAEQQLDEAQAASTSDFRDAYVALVADELSFSAGMGPANAVCIAETIADDEVARKGFSVSVTYGEPVDADTEAALTAAFDGCGEDFSQLAGSGAQPGQQYGDNPELDALQDGCAGGDGAACDELFAVSEVGSEYERFGRTCGDRFTEADAPFSCDGEI